MIEGKQSGQKYFEVLKQMLQERGLESIELKNLSEDDKIKFQLRFFYEIFFCDIFVYQRYVTATIHDVKRQKPLRDWQWSQNQMSPDELVQNLFQYAEQIQ